MQIFKTIHLLLIENNKDIHTFYQLATTRHSSFLLIRGEMSILLLIGNDEDIHTFHSLATINILILFIDWHESRPLGVPRRMQAHGQPHLGSAFPQQSKSQAVQTIYIRPVEFSTAERVTYRP